MANVLCPSCGHPFKAVKCQCRGHIISAAAWELGRWDWRPLFGSFRDGVRPSDLDFIVEKNGQFLVFETKGPEVQDIPTGQLRMLRELASLPEFTVGVIWGEPDEPTSMQIIGQPRHPVTNGELWRFSADWWVSALRHPRKRLMRGEKS